MQNLHGLYSLHVVIKMIVSRWVRVTGLSKGGYGRNGDKTLVGRSVEKYLVDRDIVGSTRLEFTVKK